MIDFLRNKWFRFALVTIIYTLWVIWMGNYWMLPGIAIIYDVYISKKVHWAFWKKKGVDKQTKTVEWIDALIFAIVAATIIRMFLVEAYTIPTPSMEKSLMVGDYLFVSKVAYGPKMPNTPLSVPFVHNKLPMTRNSKSYVEWINRPYKRLAGLGEVKRGDAIVFNFPDGDTVASDPLYVGHSYYNICRQFGRKTVWEHPEEFGEIISRPVDKRENYIKRCVALPGDTLEIVDGLLYINGFLSESYEGLQYNYYVKTNGKAINPKILDRLGIPKADYMNRFKDGYYHALPLTDEQLKEVEALPNVLKVTRKNEIKGKMESRVFPHSLRYNWNEDNFGPLIMPEKGQTIELTTENLPIYRRVIEVFEENELLVDGKTIRINGEVAESYTFKMNYYWAMGDNRHNSADSRYWGFVPEDHLVGKAVFVWLSLDKEKGLFSGKIRFNRMFHSVRSLLN